MIDQLIAAGYGNVSLYRTLADIQDTSGGVISDEFLEVLANCPAGSPILTKKLKDYEGITGGIAINTDGTVFTTSIKGRSYYGQTGYSTYPPNHSGVGRELFTYANSPEYYIDLKSGGKTYKVFAIAWSSGETPQPTTFVLSNEEGRLIDQMIAAGYGNASLYETLVGLKDTSGGVISDEFIEVLRACPASSPIFTHKLNEYAGITGGIAINTDGTAFNTNIKGRSYYGQPGYSTYPPEQSGVGRELFTYADSPEYYIDLGSNDSGGPYYAFAIAWSGEKSDAITVAGTATDDTAILQIDNKTPSVRDKTWDINVTAGTVKAGVSASDVTLTGLPAGLNYTAAKGTGNNIVITLTGAATTALTGDATITAVIKGSAVTEAGARDSEGIALKLWYVGAGTTIALSNENGLIDKLIAAGHGNDNLYKALELLQPYFSGVITDRFMKTLDSTPAGSEVFTAALSSFAGVNNPVCINVDGTVRVQPIYGRNYHDKPGYTTTKSNMAGVGTVWATAADSPAYYINAGTATVGDNTITYKAFAVVWMPDLTPVGDLTKNDHIIVYPNPTKGIVWFDLQVNDPIIKVEVYDIKGKQLFCTDHVKENHIDLSGLKNGIYLLKLETHNQKLNQKVIKE